MDSTFQKKKTISSTHAHMSKIHAHIPKNNVVES
jgi:hypothetical protein